MLACTMLGMLELFPDLVVEDPKEDLIRWANRSESHLKKYGEGLAPPEGIFDYPDLLDRGWGWKRLVTSESSLEDMPTYKKYLEDYYRRNTAESVAQAWLNERDANSASYGTGVETRFLATLAKLCIEAEKKFIHKRKMYKPEPADEINLSEKILQGVRRIMCLEGEFPVAPAAVMFITKEAELMCEWLEIGTYDPSHDWCVSINIACRCALDFLEYKGPESSCVAGLMIGIAKETKTICEAMRKNPRGSRKASSNAILLDGWDVLEVLHGEIFSASQDGAIAEINTVGELASKENDGKDSSKTKASADVNSANPNSSLEVATVKGLIDCIKKLEEPKIVKGQSQDGADVNTADPNTLLMQL